MWDFASGRELHRIGGFRVGPTSLSFAPDGKSIATAGSWEPLPRIWDIGTGREAFAQPGHVMGISTLAVSPADGTIFTGSYDGTVRRWDPTTGRELGEIARFNSVLTLAVAPDGRSPDNPADRIYPAHLFSRASGVTHYENLANLAEVAARRFTFFGFPLQIRGGHGSPVRAVAILDD